MPCLRFVYSKQLAERNLIVAQSLKDIVRWFDELLEVLLFLHVFGADDYEDTIDYILLIHLIQFDVFRTEFHLGIVVEG